MTTEHIYINPLDPTSGGHLKNTGSLSSFWPGFCPNKVTGIEATSSMEWISPHGGHAMTINKDHNSQFAGIGSNNSNALGGKSVRNEYNLSSINVPGFGAKPGTVDSDALFSCTPIFYATGYFSNRKNSHGFGWSIVDTHGGCPSDVGGIHIRVTNFADTNAVKARDNSHGVTNIPVAKSTYGADWQFNRFWAIYRAKQGHYFSMPLYPNGDNYGGDANKTNADTNTYVFRDSPLWHELPSEKVGDSSFFNKGDYYDGNKSFVLNLIHDANTVPPHNALFCGFEFDVWWGTSGSANHHRTFSISEFCPIPGFIVEKIRGKGGLYNPEYYVIPPEYTRFDDMGSGGRYEINKYKPGFKGNPNL